jgi:hypothetical protein
VFVEDAIAYLASKAIRVARGPGEEVIVHCLFCPDGDPKGKGKMYVNADTWLYDCKRCGTRGNRKTLMRHFGDEDVVEYMPGLNPAMRRKALSEATDIAAEMLLENQPILDQLKARGLSMRTIVDARLGYVPTGWSLCGSLKSTNVVADLIASGLMTEKGQDFLANRITIPYQSHGDVVQLRGKDPQPGGKYLTPTGDAVRLYNADRLQDALDVIIVEGEFDALVLQQHLQLSGDSKLMATAVVGIPGAEALPTGFLSYFEGARRVYVALDPDDTGMRAAIRIKDLLGSKARIVHLPEDLPKCDWSEFFSARGKTWRDVVPLLAAADSEGRRLWTIGDAETSWRYVEDEVGGVKLGFPELDDWMDPGMKPGQVLIPLAKTGVGKTNFLCNVAWYTRTRPLLYVTLEMTRAEIYERLRRIAFFWNPLYTDEQIREEFKLLRIVDQNRLKEGDLARLCEEYAEEVGIAPQLAFVDYLGYYAKGVKGTGLYEKTTNAAMSLKEDAKGAFVSLITPHQVNRSADDGKPLDMDDARDSGAVEETADMIISLYAPADSVKAVDGRPTSATVRTQILKNRNGPKGMAASFTFSNASLVLVPANTPAAQLCEEENRMIWRGAKYPEVRAFRRGGEHADRQLRLA